MPELVDCKLEYPLSPRFHLFEKLRIFSTCDLPQMQLLTPLVRVVQSVGRQLQKEGASLESGLPVSCVFSDSDTFSLRLLPEEKAVVSRIIFFSLPRLAPYYGTKTLYVILAEELCRQFWSIHGEALVAFKVFEILRRIFPELEIEEIYSRDIAELYHKWAGDQPEEAEDLPVGRRPFSS